MVRNFVSADKTVASDTNRVQSLIFVLFQGTSFMTIRATDGDSELNSYGVVHYFYVPNSENPSASNGRDRFSVNSAGQVSLLQSIDRENIQQITFLALAMDGFEGG